jgi:hypothetical protein
MGRLVASWDITANLPERFQVETTDRLTREAREMFWSTRRICPERLLWLRVCVAPDMRGNAPGRHGYSLDWRS